MTTTPLVEAAGAGLSIGDRMIFHDVSLTVAAGEIVAIVGTNGSGKTSLLNAFSALMRFTTGEARLYGTAIAHSGPAAIATRGRGVARSFQVPFLQDEFSAWMNVRLGIRIARAAGADTRTFLRNARKVTELFSLGPVHDAPVANMSLGQRRRVELARVFATGAGIVLLDEPFANLDDAGMETVGTLMRISAGGGAAVLIVEHRQEAIAKFCDKSVSMYDGRIITNN